MGLMKAMRLPANSVFMTSLSTRFVPALLEDMETLSDVQRTRGAKLKGIRGKGPVMMPLLSNSLERSVGVAEAMEARGIVE
jgi:energy-coupling factor transport system permease protein